MFGEIYIITNLPFCNHFIYELGGGKSIENYVLFGKYLDNKRKKGSTNQ